MVKTRRWALAGLLLAVALPIVGCPDSQPTYATLGDARTAALAARDQARAARDARDPAAGAAAAAAAAHALAQAEALSGSAPVTSAADPLGELRRAAREARDLAQETDERARLEAQLTGMKARAYRSVRATALTATFTGLSLAAKQADARGLDALPVTARDAALQAATWAESATGRPPKADGSKDWKGIAADMDRLSATPPPTVGLSLALGFLVIGKSGLALIETEALDPAGEKDPTNRLVLHLLRAFARNANGFKRLAILEIEGGLEGNEKSGFSAGGVALSGAEVLGSIHLMLGVFYLDQKDYAAADRELALALQVWPENPAATFLTGELLLATGERVRAAESLETVVKGDGEDAEWVAARIAERARAIRDGKEDADGGLVGDPVFLTRIALHALWKAADRSPQAARARAEVERARAFCGDLLGQLPGMGDDAPADTAPVVTR